MPARRAEPVSCAVPFPKGMLHEPRVALASGDGAQVAVQATVTDRWPDHSIRWLLLDWQANGACGQESAYSVVPGSPLRGQALTIQSDTRETIVHTGVATFVMRRDAFPFHSVRLGSNEIVDAAAGGLRCEDATGVARTVILHEITVERNGPQHAIVLARGQIGEDGAIDLWCWMHFYVGSPVVGFELMIRNPRRAEHPGGIWTLGDPGSLFLKEVALTFALTDEAPIEVLASPERGLPLTPVDGSAYELYQDSSGGDRWNGSVHVNRLGVVPHSFRGYRVRRGGSESFGLRATPMVQVHSGAKAIAIAVEEFWQNFPKALEVAGNRITLSLFPRQTADGHELQGGEQKTHAFAVAFGPDPTDGSLDWVRAPAVAHCTPEWYASSNAVSYLTPVETDPNRTYISLCYAALDGSDTFEHKREVIDQYGWRNFGDIYGDHEAIHDPGRLVSHYNNQYDPIAGFAYQFMRSGDVRWWRQMTQLARHVVDIDIYHTDQDRAAYNHGLFWHTVHYIDAGTSTHRSYPRAAGVHGGGPASDHNYTTGLMLHAFLTGCTWSRNAAIELAAFVIDRDDPRATPLQWISRDYTGLATLSQDQYYGPGRASGDSVNALLDGYRLTGEERYLDKAEQLIRRCIHPAEDIARHNLLDAERRWFYTMMLQSTAKYLDILEERGTINRLYGYAQAALLHYARWMANHERPYLDHPEQLEFPTETWAAQDMRKSDVFKYAARHARGAERERFLERSNFFFRVSTETLATKPTRTLARPVVLMITHGHMHAWFERAGSAIDAVVAPAADYGLPEVFVPQFVSAKRRVIRMMALAATAVLLTVWWLG